MAAERLANGRFIRREPAASTLVLRVALEWSDISCPLHGHWQGVRSSIATVGTVARVALSRSLPVARRCALAPGTQVILPASPSLLQALRAADVTMGDALEIAVTHPTRTAVDVAVRRLEPTATASEPEPEVAAPEPEPALPPPRVPVPLPARIACGECGRTVAPLQAHQKFCSLTCRQRDRVRRNRARRAAATVVPA